MSKVTSKLQVTIPRAVADRHGIAPGQEIDWLDAGEAIRVVPSTTRAARHADRARRLAVFDDATERQRERDAGRQLPDAGQSRRWNRDELYRRGVAD